MKALTLTQPWATLVAIGAKKIETRSWSTSYRGPLAIHAAKAAHREEAALCLQEPFTSALGGRVLYELPLGRVVATVRLVDVRPTSMTIGEAAWSDPRQDIVLSPQEEAFGDFTPGR